MSGFQPVNTTLAVAAPPPRPEESTPTTPRPSFPQEQSMDAVTENMDIEDVAKTPTRDSFGGMAGQKPLPSSPLQVHSHMRSDSKMEPPPQLKREGSHSTTKSLDATSQGMDIDIKDDEMSDEDDSDERPSKKKKGQRFFCTDFPPCNLSFTRSEHLARHIRKHTGERPFQCHCSRRFSRLDNLRQHAQTVHVNEDIPGDSLAATGTRFQRQVRTDRVRPPGARSRASTLGSTGAHSRGHSRNLSASSITSVGSNASSLVSDDFRRPTPMITPEGVARNRLSLETYGSMATGSPGYFAAHSPSGYSTPTSTTFSQGTGSPRYSSGFHSPISTSIPRSVNFEPRTPSRRLSVPGAPYTPSNATSYPSPYLSSVQSASGNSSMFASPSSSGFGHSRRESLSSIDVDLKRRTWHPNTGTGLVPRPGTSGLQQYQTPDQPRPVFGPEKVAPANSQTRLPGIESFDHAPPPPVVPRRILSPMQIDPPQQQSLTAVASQPEQRDNRLSWDSTLQRGLSNMELERAQQQAERGTVQFGPTTYINETHRPSTSHSATQEQRRPHVSFDSSRNRYSDEPVAEARTKRMAWYNGPISQQGPLPGAYPPATALRTSPDGSSSSDGVPTPSNGSMAGTHPAIVHSDGYVEHRPHYAHAVEDQSKIQQHPPPPAHFGPAFSSNAVPQYGPQHNVPHQAQNATYALQSAQQVPRPQQQPQAYSQTPSAGNDMQRLEALVAVATRENQATNAH